MKTIPEKLRKNGFDYELLERCDTCAIYKQIDTRENGEKVIIAYEVFEIRKRKECEINGTKIEGGEIFPGNNAFGKYAWSCTTYNGSKPEHGLADAYKKYEEIKKSLV